MSVVQILFLLVATCVASALFAWARAGTIAAVRAEREAVSSSC